MEELRDVAVKRNGAGYLLQTGTKIERVTPTEVERLMESILKAHPGVPDGVAAAWENRYAPVIEVSEFLGVVDMEIVPVGYQATVLIVGEELSHLKSEIRADPETAATEMESLWGCPLHILPELNRVNSSRKVAENNLLTLRAEEFCKERGITMDQLWEEITKQKESEDARVENDVEVHQGNEEHSTV